MFGHKPGVNDDIEPEFDNTAFGGVCDRECVDARDIAEGTMVCGREAWIGNEVIPEPG